MKHRLLRVIAFLAPLLPACTPVYADEHWVEEARLHDGRTLEVQRSVEYKRGRSDLTSFFTFYPTAYSLRFEHPVLGTTIRWSGADNVHPIAIGFVGNTPYLAVYGNTAGAIHDNSKLYGCPEVPFAFVRYDLDVRRWVPVAPAEAPAAVRRANLTTRYIKGQAGRISAKEIELRNASAERSGGYFQTAIPSSADEWAYKNKKVHLTSRSRNDCRPPLDQPIDAVFPRKDGVLSAPSTAVELEELGRKEFSPPWVLDERSAEWRTQVHDMERTKRCQALYRQADPQDRRLQGWIEFGLPGERTKLSARWPEICDEDAMWFFGRHSTSPKDNRLVIAKVTHAGDVLYRISFQRPDYWGFIARPTFIRKDGYIYFDWWDADGGMKREVKKIVRMRVREPRP